MEVEQYGKPTKLTFDYAERHLQKQVKLRGIKINRFYMIGDTPSSDIGGANAKGWTTILVRTGVFDPKAETSTKDGNDKENPATYVVEDFEEAVDLIYKLEGLNDKNV